jgi:hypothetical protein
MRAVDHRAVSIGQQLAWRRVGAPAAQQPYVFLWANNTYDVVRTAVRTVNGPLDLSVPNWTWQPERLVVTAANR